MSDSRTHLITGALVGGIADCLFARVNGKEVTLKNFIEGAVIGAASGVLPDSLEPPTSPLHRSFFHSYAILCGEVYGIHKLIGSSLDPALKKVLLVTFFAYGSHLFLDSGTPARLPLVG